MLMPIPNFAALLYCLTFHDTAFLIEEHTLRYLLYFDHFTHNENPVLSFFQSKPLDNDALGDK